MRLFLIRHGTPNYELDNLTELGKIEAKNVSKVFQNIKFDRIYASSCGRAIETASYTAETHNMKVIPQDWAREDWGGRYFGFHDKITGKFEWYFMTKEFQEAFVSEEVFNLGHKWFEHPLIKKTEMKQGYEKMNKDANAFLEELGFKRDSKTCAITKIPGSETLNNVALFAHGGFAMSFLSVITGIPYPTICMTLGHLNTTGISIIDILGDGFPARILIHNNFSHNSDGCGKEFYTIEINKEMKI